jgi:hypothetical protein
MEAFSRKNNEKRAGQDRLWGFSGKLAAAKCDIFIKN